MRSSTQAFLCVHSEQRGCSQTLLSRQGQLHGAVIHMLYSDYNCVVECYFLMYDWEGFIVFFFIQTLFFWSTFGKLGRTAALNLKQHASHLI